MSIDKSIGQAPSGLASLADDAEPLTIEIVDPEEVNIHAGPLDIHMEHSEPAFDANIAEEMPESSLASLAYDLMADVTEDMNGRKDWLEIYIKGLKLLGLKYEDRSEPWPGASGVYHPLLMEAAVKFQSDLIMETFPSAGPVRTKIIGKETPDKKQSAARVQEDMNYELTEVMQEYRPEHERLLLATALSGNAFKKVYFDPALDRQVAPFIPAEDIIVPYGAPNLQASERITHRMRKTKNELRRLMVAGFYRDVDLGDPVQVLDEIEKQKATEQGFTASIDNRYQLFEMHVDLDLEGYEDTDKHGEPTGIKLPYVVTVEKGTNTILAIRRNWLEDDKLKQRRQHFVHYGYIPGFGFYYFGLIHLIGGHTHTATSLMRQLIDAGTLSNLPGGLKARGMRVKGDDTPIAPGEFRDVDLPSGAIRDNILPLPYKEPSQVLMALMDKVVADGRQFAATAELNISDMSAQAPVGTTLAILERVMKVMSAVQARIHYTMKDEFKLLAAIIRDNTPESYDYQPEIGDAGAKRSDYDCCDVIPVSDPNASTMAQRVVQYQAVMQLAQQAPQIYDLPFLHRQMIEVLGVKNAQKIVPLKDDMLPVDPVSENMGLLINKPVKAFMYQDHKAHLLVHNALLHDPLMAAQIGQNPQAPQIMAAVNAHIMEHLAYQYRADIQTKLGAVLPPPPKAMQAGSDMSEDNDPGFLPPEEEVQISQLAALAAQQLMQQNQAKQQQQQIQQQMQDPLIQLQQQEIQLKQQQMQLDAQLKQADLQFRQQQAAADNQLKQQQFQMEIQLQQEQLAQKSKIDMLAAASKVDETRIKSQQADKTHELESARLGVEVAKHKAEQRMAGAKMGAEIAKHKADKAHDRVKTGVDALKHAVSVRNDNNRAEADRQHEAAENEANRQAQAQQVQEQPPQGAEESE
jgi:hypothetical protein